MPINFTCACGAKIKTGNENAGKTSVCPACKEPVKVPSDEVDLGVIEYGDLAPAIRSSRARWIVCSAVVIGLATLGFGLLFVFGRREPEIRVSPAANQKPVASQVQVDRHPPTESIVHEVLTEDEVLEGAKLFVCLDAARYFRETGRRENITTMANDVKRITTDDRKIDSLWEANAYVAFWAGDPGRARPPADGFNVSYRVLFRFTPDGRSTVFWREIQDAHTQLQLRFRRHEPESEWNGEFRSVVRNEWARVIRRLNSAVASERLNWLDHAELFRIAMNEQSRSLKISVEELQEIMTCRD